MSMSMSMSMDMSVKVHAVPKKRKRLDEKKAGKVKKSVNDSADATPSPSQLKRLLGLYQSDKLPEAERLAVLLTRKFPTHAFAWKVLGSLFKKTGKIDESLAAKQKSVGLAPHDAEAHNNLGVTLQELGSFGDATASYRRAIVLNPDYAEAHNNLGNALREQGRLDAAEASLRRAIELNPNYATAHKNLGCTLRELGKSDEAEACYRHAITLSPSYPDTYCGLGVMLHKLGKLEQAAASFRQAIALKPNYAEALGNLGATLQELGKLDESQACYKQAIALRPNFAEAHRHLAMTKEFSSEDGQFRQMRDLYLDPATPENAKCHLAFALAKASEDLENFADSFQFYTEGNSLGKKEFSYNKAQEKNRFDRLKGAYPRLAEFSLLPEMVVPEHTPIFIVGMPRSGTTLAEQIISSHPLVTGAGELGLAAQFGSRLAAGTTSINGEALASFREQYIGGLRQFSEGNAIVTDKMPQNFALLGLITAALPDAKIIHVKRDPAAVCWANYTQYFSRASLRYCYSLDDVLHYHELYRDLMRYWHQVFPNRIYDLNYEGLTEHQEEETRKLIDYLGLEWDDACLSPEKNRRAVRTASSVQVRSSVYRNSSDRWKRYRPYLNGLLDHFD